MSPRLPPKPSILPDHGGLAGQQSGVPAATGQLPFLSSPVATRLNATGPLAN